MTKQQLIEVIQNLPDRLIPESEHHAALVFCAALEYYAAEVQLDTKRFQKWLFFVSINHPWRRQLYSKERIIEIIQNLPDRLIPELESFVAELQLSTRLMQEQEWLYLVSRSHPWRRQLYIKGRKLLASTVWQDLIANDMSPEQAAENWDLPIAVIYEVIRYCEGNQDLLRLEAEEEKYRLKRKGVDLEPKFAA